jgi:hypothetical protein
MHVSSLEREGRKKKERVIVEQLESVGLGCVTFREV